MTSLCMHPLQKLRSSAAGRVTSSDLMPRFVIRQCASSAAAFMPICDLRRTESISFSHINGVVDLHMNVTGEERLRT